MKPKTARPPLDRRRYPRVDKALRIDVGRGDDQLATETMNLSCGGVLCRLDRPLPIMTKVSIALALPKQLIHCTGVVVRCESVPRAAAPSDSRYRVALFFSDLGRRDHRVIAEYVLKSMMSHAHGRRRP